MFQVALSNIRTDLDLCLGETACGAGQCKELIMFIFTCILGLFFNATS